MILNDRLASPNGSSLPEPIPCDARSAAYGFGCVISISIPSGVRVNFRPTVDARLRTTLFALNRAFESQRHVCKPKAFSVDIGPWSNGAGVREKRWSTSWPAVFRRFKPADVRLHGLGFLSSTLRPESARLNFRPATVETRVITTPFSFFIVALEPAPLSASFDSAI